MFNIDVRDAIKKARVYGYEVAAALGVHESALSRKLARRELSAEEKETMLKAIEKAKEANT